MDARQQSERRPRPVPSSAHAGSRGVALQPPSRRTKAIEHLQSNPRVARLRAAEGDQSSRLPPAGLGKKLPHSLQSKMERAFACDFSAVRVHRDARATALHAQAYTQGTAIHLAPNIASLHSVKGQELLGHELAHVVQQRHGQVRTTGVQSGLPINQDLALERAADQMGHRAARGLPVGDGDGVRMGMALSARVPGALPAQMLAEVPVLRKQKGGTCGCYSLWMAIESLRGEDPTLLKLILEAARASGSALGENFAYKSLEDLVVELNELLEGSGYNYQVQIERKNFYNARGLKALIEDSPDGTEALLVGYDSGVFMEDAPGTPAFRAHWSVIESFQSEHVLVLANPWGERYHLGIRALFRANASLRKGKFSWKDFADDLLRELQHDVEEVDPVLEGADLEMANERRRDALLKQDQALGVLSGYASGIGRDLLSATLEMTGRAVEGEGEDQGKESEDLAGFLVSVRTE